MQVLLACLCLRMPGVSHLAYKIQPPMSQLIICLPLPGAPLAAPWHYVVSQTGQAVSRHGMAEVALLPHAGMHEVIALVPAQALSWHCVDLPKGSTANPARLRSVLDGVLEDRLLDDPADLHFALAPDSTAPCRCWVAACQTAWLRLCMDQLEAAGCTVARIVPEFTPSSTPALADADPPPQAAPPDARLYATGHDAASAWWVRMGSDLSSTAQPVGVLLWPLPDPAHVSLHETATALQPVGLMTVPTGQIQSDPAVAKAAEHWLRHPVAVQHPSERWLHAVQSRWNLAQFAFSSRSSDRLRKRSGQVWRHFLHAPHWRAVRWGLAALLLVQVVGLNGWAWRTRQTLAAQKREVARILTTTFPDVQVVVDAPAQMQRQLALLEQASGQPSTRDMDVMLSLTAQNLPQSHLQALQWDGAQLRLKGLSVSGDQQSRWQAALQQHHIDVRQDGADWLLTPKP